MGFFDGLKKDKGVPVEAPQVDMPVSEKIIGMDSDNESLKNIIDPVDVSRETITKEVDRLKSYSE